MTKYGVYSLLNSSVVNEKNLGGDFNRCDGVGRVVQNYTKFLAGYVAFKG